APITCLFFFFSSRRRHTRFSRDWSSDVCSSDLYMTSPLHAILRHSVDVWQSDPVNLGFQQVGYVSVGEANQQSDYERIVESQNEIGRASCRERVKIQVVDGTYRKRIGRRKR